MFFYSKINDLKLCTRETIEASDIGHRGQAFDKSARTGIGAHEPLNNTRCQRDDCQFVRYIHASTSFPLDVGRKLV